MHYIVVTELQSPGEEPVCKVKVKNNLMAFQNYSIFGKAR